MKASLESVSAVMAGPRKSCAPGAERRGGEAGVYRPRNRVALDRARTIERQVEWASQMCLPRDLVAVDLSVLDGHGARRVRQGAGQVRARRLEYEGCILRTHRRVHLHFPAPIDRHGFLRGE